MNWVEEILIICGISLDIFAAMTCQGSKVAKIEKKNLALFCGLVAFLQVVTLYLGILLSTFWEKRIGGHEVYLGRVMADAILFCLGIRLLIKAWKNERIEERREEHISWKKFMLTIAGTSFYTFLTGVAFEFLGINLMAVLIMVVCISILVVIFGMYTGYRLGSRQKMKAYVAGALLLMIAGVDVIVKYIV